MVFVSVADKKFRFLCQKPAKPVLFFDISLVSDRKSMLFSFLEMLVIFRIAPTTAPLEAE